MRNKRKNLNSGELRKILQSIKKIPVWMDLPLPD
jgi:hypothetical protein